MILCSDPQPNRLEYQELSQLPVVKTNGKRTCEVCGTALNEYSEFCPVCALRGAISPETESLSEISSELCFEHYQVLKNEDGAPMELGRGGMGVTYKAIDTHLRCPVALKIIRAQFIGSESARSRFLREARAAASVRHSNVASVFHLGESGGNYFYAMEFVDGETLEALIRRRGQLEIELALEIVVQVAAGLTAIHKQHLVHRDIKPSNIMLTWDEGRLENVKIIDLGLAKGVTEDTLSIAGSFIGTPVYASPEQFAGLGTDIRSDLYSLAVTLWEMLSGKPPFHGSVAELMDQHQHAVPPFEKLRNSPEPNIALLDVLLAKDPSRRFQDPAQLQKAMTKVRGAIGSGLRLTAEELRSVGAQVTANTSNGKPKKQTVPWVLGIGLCLATGLIAWFSFFFHSGLLSNQRITEAVPIEKSIAVLPFESLSDSKSDIYFADGVQDEILNNLAKIAQLKVISRTSVMQYRADAKRDLREIANALGVANVLEGTVRRDGNHVRVSTELVDARKDNTIWADSYDRDLTGIFAIQSEIAQTVASRLSARLLPEEEKSIAEKPTDNLEAYDLYLQAKQLINSLVFFGGATETSLKAISLLEQATAKDPQFALAYCWIANEQDNLYFSRIDHTPERRALGDAALNEAMRLRPDLPEVHLALADHLYKLRDFERARVQIAIAAQVLPNNHDLLRLTADIDQVQGHWEKATAGLERAATLDPRNPQDLSALADNYVCLRRYRDNERILDRLIELEPDSPKAPLRKALGAFPWKGRSEGRPYCLRGACAFDKRLSPGDKHARLLGDVRTRLCRRGRNSQRKFRQRDSLSLRFSSAANPGALA
jgi:serine/threonine protein kinase